jgi:hypothetical protein
MSESTLNGFGNRRNDGRRRFDRNNNRGDRPQRNHNERTEAKEGGK